MMNDLNMLGIDIGSTTVKVVLMDKDMNLLFSDYRRHFANIKETLAELIEDAFKVTGDVMVAPVITGSGGLTLANAIDVPFTQEVVAVSTALRYCAPQTDVAIELGGEDAKIIYFEDGNAEQRMNGICAGGTGSFIDQMASLLQTDSTGLKVAVDMQERICTLPIPPAIPPETSEALREPQEIEPVLMQDSIRALEAEEP